MKILECVALVLAIIVLIPFAISAVGLLVEWIIDRVGRKDD